MYRMYIFGCTRSIIILCGLCFTYTVADHDNMSQLSNENFSNKDVLEELYKLQIQMNNLRKENEGLKKEQKLLTMETRTLQTRIETLEMVVKGLHSAKNELKTKQTHFQKECIALRKDVAFQNSQISGIQREFSSNRELMHSVESGKPVNITAIKASIARMEQYIMEAAGKTVNDRIWNLEQTLRTTTNSIRNPEVNGNTGISLRL